MAKIHSNKRLLAVQYYLKNKTTLKQAALLFKIHYITLFKYVALYRKYGEKRLILNYRRPWNRASKVLEEKIVALKENNPSLTIKKAQELLHNEGIKISIKGIWGIWKRYGYAGYDKKKLSVKFTDYIQWTKEARAKYEVAQKSYAQGNIELTAEIMNTIPMLPNNELLQNIPDSLLNIKRKVEKMAMLYGQMPAPSYFHRLKETCEECMKQGLYFSALRLWIIQLYNLSWLGQFKEQIELISKIKKIISNDGKGTSVSLFPLRYPLLIAEGFVYTKLFKINRAYEIIKSCRRLLLRRSYPIPYFMQSLGILYTHVDDYKNAEYWYTKALAEYEKWNQDCSEINNSLSTVYILKGNYQKALSFLKKLKTASWNGEVKYLLTQGLKSLTEGSPHQAMQFAAEAIDLLKKDGIYWGIYSANFIIASALYSLGESTRAIRNLQETLKFITNKYAKESLILKLLIAHICDKPLPPKSSFNNLPRVKVAKLLCQGKYFEALKYAEKKGIMSDIHRCVVFFPEMMRRVLERRVSAGLPRKMFQLPIFNYKSLAYNVKFLGDLVVYKNQKYLGCKLGSKDSAFLTYLCFNAFEPGKSINLEEIYTTFWPKSENASRNLSHLLVRLKKALKIPTHLLEISRAYGNPILINQGVYFTTDYQEFEQTLARAKALQRAGEWGFARKEYLRAFKLFRGEPFKKNFDNWSVDMRFKILSQFETEAINFAKSCLEHSNKTDARKILQKVLKIIPDAEEAKNLLDSLSTGLKKS
ncbi:MAG: hypothetical protein ABIL40_09595 [candidate division WOR-3 bacterium]